MESTEYMLNLEKELMTVRKVAETTARGYIKSLYALNKKKPFKNINFLKKTDDIDSVIAEYAESTQRGLLATITSVLSLYKDKSGYKKLYQHYHDKMMQRVEDKREEEKEGGVKSKKQTENWLSWDTIQSRKNELKGGLVPDKKRSVDTDEYDKLLQYVVLALYTEVQPRRNQDYLDMYIVKKWNDKMPTDKNYLDIAGKRFVYNVYKTSKKYGTQIVEIPPALSETLQLFLKHHPLWKEGKRKSDPVKLLVNADGTPITAVNAITRMLNKVFDKKIGSSMLRHVFLTDKYKDTLDEMKKDSDAMGHSTSQQRDYVLADKVDEPESKE
jgi:integrase